MSNKLRLLLPMARAVVPLVDLVVGTHFSLHEAAVSELIKQLANDRPLCKLDMVKGGIIDNVLDILPEAPDTLCALSTELLRILTNNSSIAKGVAAPTVVEPLFYSLTRPDMSTCGQHSAMQVLVNILEKPQPLANLTLSPNQAIEPLVLRFSSQYYFKVPSAVLVKLLRSSNEATVVVALSALILLEREDSSSAEGMGAEAEAVEALLELLRCHQCEEAAARLLEALFNNCKVRDTKAARLAIAPLAQYMLDPQTRTLPARLLAALALGDLFQLEGLSLSNDAVSACRALVSLLEDQPTEEMKMVSVCALQNLVVTSRANNRAVAEAGGVQVVQELLASSNSESAAQAAILIKLIFANHTIQEYASSEMIRALAAALEMVHLWATASVNEDVAKALTVMLSNFSRLRFTDEPT